MRGVRRRGEKIRGEDEALLETSIKNKMENKF
jgi:hypothetical protein